MKLFKNPNEIEREFSRLIKRYKHVSFAVAWANTGFSGYRLLVKQKKKIKKGIVGIHFITLIRNSSIIFAPTNECYL
jgi:hypothetical protein